MFNYNLFVKMNDFLQAKSKYFITYSIHPMKVEKKNVCS